MPERTAYFDYASTSPVMEAAREAMLPFLAGNFGNPSSPHASGRTARAAVDRSRDLTAGLIGAKSSEIIFTGCGSESIFLSLTGCVLGNSHRGRHLITTGIEHHAMLGTFEFLSDHLGCEISFVNVDRNAGIDFDALDGIIRNDTILISAMGVNNETGTIQDLQRLASICSDRGIFCHSDCVQAFGKIPLDMNELNLDLACASAHKFGGPKGTGFLFVREGTHIHSLLGGSHEFGIRAGTENVAGIVGMSVALEGHIRKIKETHDRLSGYRRQVIDVIKSAATDFRINGSEEHNYPGILSVLLPGVSGEMMVLALDREGVHCSTGSACSAGSVEPSHVLTAMGISFIDASSALRISTGYATTDEDIARFGDVFPEIYNRVKNTN